MLVPAPLRLLIVVSSAFALVACSTPSFLSRTDSASAATVPRNDLAAQNLVFSLAQLDELHPLSTTVQLVESDPALRQPFGRAVVNRVADAGYGVQRVSSPQIGRNVLVTSRVLEDSSSGLNVRYTATVGKISVERSYRLEADSMVPVSAITLTGVPVQDILGNDEIFDIIPATDVASVIFNGVDDAQPAASLDLAVLAGTVTEHDEAFGAAVHANMYETLRSNYAPLFAGYDDVREEIVVFGNDSMMLGSDGKRLVRSIIDEFRIETDVISVIGCSHGRTSLDGGNERLAVGRADRTKEEFIFSGVPFNQVLEEGCWSPTPFDEVMPRRGVLVTLKRKG